MTLVFTSDPDTQLPLAVILKQNVKKTEPPPSSLHHTSTFNTQWGNEDQIISVITPISGKGRNDQFRLEGRENYSLHLRRSYKQSHSAGMDAGGFVTIYTELSYSQIEIEIKFCCCN